MSIVSLELDVMNKLVDDIKTFNVARSVHIRIAQKNSEQKKLMWEIHESCKR